jgi:hypothetical protein
MAHGLDLTSLRARMTEVTAVGLPQDEILVARHDPGYEEHR